VKRSVGERVGRGIIYSVLAVLMVITLYPFWHVLMYALSDSKKALEGGLFLWPKGISFLQFKLVFQSRGVFVSYGNSIFRTVVGTTINVLMTATIAYPLSRRRLVGRNLLSMLIFFTMMFSGGMIPTYLLVRSLGLLDTRWALILPTSISAYFMFIMRNFFQGVPASLEESAHLDGASPMRILFSIMLPVSKPVLAAISLFYAVLHWNAFFDAVLYIDSVGKQVLQVFLRVMLQHSALDQLAGIESYEDTSALTESSVRMAIITISVVPMLVVYPFLQKYYVKGIMIGSIKG
jgi:putative aldouronate transport system permease protein